MMPAPSELFSIVVVGGMNPRIHHPAWYETAEVLSAEEARSALGRPVVCLPMLSQFEGERFSITCIEDRWEIVTPDPQRSERILEIAGKTFDTLMHTPVSAFGLNFQFVRHTGSEAVGRRLADLVNSLPLGRKGSATDSATIVTTTTLADRTLQETLSEVQDTTGFVRVAYNVHHPIKGKTGLFALTPLLRAAWQEDYSDCLDRADRVAKALTAEQKG